MKFRHHKLKISFASYSAFHKEYLSSAVSSLAIHAVNEVGDEGKAKEKEERETMKGATTESDTDDEKHDEDERKKAEEAKEHVEQKEETKDESESEDEFVNEEEGCDGPTMIPIPSVLSHYQPEETTSSSTSSSAAVFRVVLMKEDSIQHLVYNDPKHNGQHKDSSTALPLTYPDLMKLF
jgi:hypothetical protein